MLLVYYLLVYGWVFSCDLDWLLVMIEWLDVLLFGAGVLVGLSLLFDFECIVALLGFVCIFDNSFDVISDRDFAVEVLFDLVLVGIYFSRIGEEWVLWMSEEFGFVCFDDVYVIGLSMLL